MKSLKDTLNRVIYEKLRVDDIVIEKFPIDGTVDEMVAFLELNNFTVLYMMKDVWSSRFAVQVANKAEDKIAYIDKKRWCIFIGDTTKQKVSVSNPLYYIGFNYKKEIVFFLVYPSSNLNIINEPPVEKKDWVTAVNKKFGWE